MSSQPDGTDPRVLQKEGETVYIGSTVRQCKGRKYHKEECEAFSDIIGEPKEIDKSVARWKNMEECQKCHGERQYIEGPQVDRWRKALVWGNVSLSAVAEGSDVASTTIRKHTKGEYKFDYDIPPKTPEIDHDKHNSLGWVWPDEWTEACPECDYGKQYRRNVKEPSFICKDCGHEFDHPVYRESHAGGTQTAAIDFDELRETLIEMDPTYTKSKPVAERMGATVCEVGKGLAELEKDGLVERWTEKTPHQWRIYTEEL